MSDFRDFIPAGEDTGALGNGFTDYVPTQAPAQQPEATKGEPAPKAVKPEPKKK